MSLIYLNGDYKSLAEASISVLDRGFTLGDGVYEIVPVFNRTIFRFEEHMQRLRNSLKSIYMNNPLSKDEWISIFEKLIDSTEGNEQSIYLQITRGISERDHDIPLAENPTIFAMSRPIVREDLSMGIKAITHEDIRWQNCDIKAITLLPGVILRRRAKEQGAREAILIRDNKVTEGVASNVFICKKNQILTPPKDNHVLPGITRELVLEILSENNMHHSERSIDVEELVTADEVWVTSSTWEIVPIIELDSKLVGNGQAGSIWKKTNRLYQEFKSRYCN